MENASSRGLCGSIWEDEEDEQENNTRTPGSRTPARGVPTFKANHQSDNQNVGTPLAGVLPAETDANLTDVNRSDGTQPNDNQMDNDTQSATQTQHHIRPISTILDPEPALLAHQRALAEWMAVYYVTPLAQVAVKMLPPGLMQRSKVVLHLINGEDLATHTTQDQQAFTRLHALIGLLLADGELTSNVLKRCSDQNKQKKYYRRLYQAA